MSQVAEQTLLFGRKADRADELFQQHQQEISQQDIKGNSTLLLFAKSLDLSDQPIEANKLAFVAPEGSRELSLDEVNASKWYENLEEAKAAAARTHKLVMVDFYADW